MRAPLTSRGVRTTFALCEARRRGDRIERKLKTEVTMTPPGQYRR